LAKFDPKLLEYATDRQREYLEAWERLGSHRKAAEALGVNARNISLAHEERGHYLMLLDMHNYITDPADWFYILLTGRIKLSLGQTGQVVYVVSHAGEAFGWSSLVGRPSYSASAECLAASKLLKFDRQKLEKIIEKDPQNGMTLFKSLATILGNRLLHGYAAGFRETRANEFTSFGTGQVMGATETEL